jgi:hypothetical protein
LGVVSYAGVAVDTDLDGVVDSIDNCDIDPNGPLLGACSAQQDGDSDGFGNSCDTDVNNNNQTDLGDVSLTLADAKASGTALVFDFDCDGATSLADVSKALADAKASKIPGPSCDQPSGTPCP